MNTDVQPRSTTVPALDGSSPGELVRAVRDMYARHLFPPPQRRNSCLQRAAHVRQFLRDEANRPPRSVIRRHRLRDWPDGIQRMTDYFGQEIPMDVTYHSANRLFAEGVGRLPFEGQCHVIDVIVWPYWISLFARKANV